MEHQQHPVALRYKDLESAFPVKQYSKMRANQGEAFRLIAQSEGSALLELPTGSGKTAIGYSYLKALAEKGVGSLYYVAPTKTLVEQIQKLHPDVKVIYGRNEYPCLYYKDQDFKADEVPCSVLDCGHRVSMETGETQEKGVTPCPYYQAKYEARRGQITVCTMAYYLFTHLFAGETAGGLVIDEAHRIAEVFRQCLTYEITDYSVRRAADFLRDVGIAREADILDQFLTKLRAIIKRRPPRTAVLLKQWEIKDLLRVLWQIDPRAFRQKIRVAAKQLFDTLERREILKTLEEIGYHLIRYIKSLEYSLPTEDRKPLNYTYGFYEKQVGDNHRVNYRLVINAYYVAPLVKMVLAPNTLAYSATISDPQVFGFESGIKSPFYTLGSDFPAEHTGIFIPTDTPNLAQKAQSRQDMTRTLRKIAKACHNFAQKGIRSLVVVISNKERDKFLVLCGEEKVKAVSYGNGIQPRAAAARFKQGEGDVLVGTIANYGSGVDLPKQVAPVIFVLRPGYPHPDDPRTLFEEERYGSQRWKVWNWRVMIEALQVRGRNVRNAEDIGVTIFLSQQFRRFIPAVLPDWLGRAFCGTKKLEEIISHVQNKLTKLQ